MGDLGERRDVGAGAEVGGGDDHRGDRVRGRVERRREALRGQPVGDAELGVELRRDEGRPHPVQHQPVDHRGVDVPLHDDLARPCGRAPCEVAWLPCEAPLIEEPACAARPRRSAASSCACWNGVGSGPMSTPSVTEGMSLIEPGHPDQLDHRRVGGEPTLVARHLEAPGLAGFEYSSRASTYGVVVLLRSQPCEPSLATAPRPRFGETARR